MQGVATSATTLTSITEGSAKIVSETSVFYNPVQQFNRDLSISVLTAFSKLCKRESEERKNGNKKIPGIDLSVRKLRCIAP